MENVVILGAGIAGLTAAIYTARANLKPSVVAGKLVGGQLMLTMDVENYPGFEKVIKGPELIRKTKEQAKQFGAGFIDAEAVGFKKEKDFFEIKLSNNNTIQAKTVIIATGADARMLGLESEKKYFGRGVTTCATCDGYFFKDREVVVIGGGDSACEESLFLSKLVSKATIIHRRDELRASKIMQKRVFDNPNIDIIWDSVVEEVLGDGNKVTGVRIRNVKTNKTKDLKTDAMFLAIGHIPNTKIFEGKIKLDKQGFIKTDEHTRTSVEGVFAAGDIQDPLYKQAVTAAGTGCKAALEAERYLQRSLT